MISPMQLSSLLPECMQSCTARKTVALSLAACDPFVVPHTMQSSILAHARGSFSTLVLLCNAVIFP